MSKLISFLLHLVKVSASVTVGFFTLVTCIVIFAMVVGVAATGAESLDVATETEYHFGDSHSSNQILSVPITGVILGSKDEIDPSSLFGGFGMTYGYEIKEQLYKAAEDEDIKAVVLEINSPGGTIYGSQAIADGVSYYRQKTGHPVLAFVSGLAASGGYWAAASAEPIVADYGTGIGSIGVITGPFNYYNNVTAIDGGLLGGGIVTQNGVENFYISAGTYKDLGNPFRKMSDEELQSLQKTVDNEYNHFVAHVAEHRKISAEAIRNDIKALIYDPTSAKEINLIDAIGNREDAYQTLAEKAGIDGQDYQVVREKQILSFVEELLQAYLKPEVTPKAQTNVCNLNKQVLAYHGSVTELCSSL